VSNNSLKLTASTMMFAIVAAVSACHSDKAARQPAEPTTEMRASSQPSTFVGTVPAQSADEKPVTPMETVGAAPR
jgi:poly(3-hydroxybutyrate) depolymerase